MSRKGQAPAIQPQRRNPLPFLIIAAVLFVALAAAFVLYRSMGEPAARPRANSAPAVVPLGATPPHATGGAVARVTLEEFADFQCPPCAALYAELQPVKREYGNRLRVVFRNLPLPRHANAPDAARAAEAAGLQNRFWEMHDQLFRNQRAWESATNARDIFTAYAREIGLDMERFARDMDSPQVAERIALDEQRATYLGVMSTPTIFINNRQMYPTEVAAAGGLRAVIAAAMDGNNQ